MLTLGITEFIRNIKLHIITVFLLVVMLLSANLISALLQYQFDKLSVFFPSFERDGLFRAVYDTMLVPEGMDSGLSGVEDIFCISYIPGEIDYRNAEGRVVTEPGMIYMYDDSVISEFEPLLQEGIWLDSVKKLENVIPCVISKNAMGYTVGDIFTVSGSSLKFLVVGLLKDGAEILGGELNYYVTDKDYSCFYETVSFDRSNSHYILTRKSDFDGQAEDMTSFMNRALIIYSSDISEEDREKNASAAQETGIGMSLSEFKDNSEIYFRNEVETYVPMCIAVFVSILITIIVLAALNYRKSMDVLGIYFACGMSPKKAVLLNAVSTACICVMSVLLTFFIMELLHFKIGNQIYLRIHVLQIWIDAGLIGMTALANILVPILQMRRLSPSEAIRKRGLMA